MMKDTLLSVLKPFGVSGSEGPIAAALTEMVRPYVDEIRTDALGNLIATKKGAGKRIMFSAHMDTIGYMALDADKEGYVRVSNIGGIGAASAANRHIVFSNGVQGIISMEPLNGESASIAKLYVDIGAATREEALEKVPIGATAALCFQSTEMGDLIAAPYMDDRAACAVLVELLKALEGSKHEVVGVFSVQEEVGCRGAGVAAYAIEPDLGVAIDVTLAGDTPKCSPGVPMKVGLGPCVKVKDSGSISTPLVRDGLVAAAGRAGVPFQYEVLPFGGTDAATIMTSRGGVPSGTLSIACRYVHAPIETVSLSDMENAVKLLKAYVEEIA